MTILWEIIFEHICTSVRSSCIVRQVFMLFSVYSCDDYKKKENTGVHWRVICVFTVSNPMHRCTFLASIGAWYRHLYKLFVHQKLQRITLSCIRVCPWKTERVSVIPVATLFFLMRVPMLLISSQSSFRIIFLTKCQLLLSQPNGSPHLKNVHSSLYFAKECSQTHIC